MPEVEVNSFIIFNRLFVGLRLPRTQTRAELTISGAGGDLLCQTSLSRKDRGCVSGGARLELIGRVFSKQQMLIFLASPTMGEAPVLAEIVKDPLTLSLLLGESEHKLTVSAKATPFEALTSLHGPILNHLRTDDATKPIVEAVLNSRLRPLVEPAMHVDLVAWEGGALFVHGWLRNIPLADVIFLADGVSRFADGESGVVHRRPDVTEFLRNQGIVTDTQNHGFSVVVPAARPTSELTAIAATNSGFQVIYSAQTNPIRQKESIFPLLLRARQDDARVSVPKITRLIAPFFPKTVVEPHYEVIRRCKLAADANAALSIVVPFYKEWRFIFSICKLMQRCPESWEWVLVCDDPDIFSELHRYIGFQPSSICERITFIGMTQNAGFGTANNIGVREAAGDVVLLMNSDIWLSSFAPLQLALEAITNDRFGLIGFELRFEDGTIQHEGMSACPEA